MNEESPAQRLLHELQKCKVDNAFGEVLKARYKATAPFLSHTISSLADAAFGENMPGLINELKEASSHEMPTPIESPTRYAILSWLKKRIESTLIEKPKYNFTIGTLPSGEFNGMAIKVPKTSNDFLIVIESGLFNYLYRLGRILQIHDASSGLISQPASIVSKIDNPKVAECLEHLVMKYLLSGRPNNSFPLPIETNQLCMQIVEAAELFVVAHEYGHVILDHFSSRKTRLRALAGEQLEEIEQSWADEFAADEKGLEIAVAAGAAAGLSPSLVFSGASLLCSAAETIIASRSLLLYGKIINSHSTTHPPMIERYQRLNNAAIRRWGGETTRLAGTCKIFFEGALELLVPRLLKYHEAKVQLAPIWN